MFNLITNKQDRRGKSRFAWLRIVGGHFEEDSKDLLHKMEGGGEFTSNSGVISLSRLAVFHGIAYLTVLII